MSVGQPLANGVRPIKIVSAATTNATSVVGAAVANTALGDSGGVGGPQYSYPPPDQGLPGARIRFRGFQLQNTTQPYSVTSSTGYPVFLKVYDKASAPTVGTDVPLMTIPLFNNGAIIRDAFDELAEVEFEKGFAYAITKNAADSDSTAVAAGDLVGSLFIEM